MAAANFSKLKSLRRFLEMKPHQEVLRLYLRSFDVGLLEDAILVTVHRAWSSQPPFELTEIGINTYDRRSVNGGFPIVLRAHAETIFNGIWSLHLRLRSSAHLPTAGGHASAYHFGTTIFVSHDEAMDMLGQIWNQPIDESNPEKGMRPVIYMHFGNNDGLSKTRKDQFSFDPAPLPTTVAVLDAQNIPVQAKITRSATASLDYLLLQFKISPINFGNAGIAAMYATTVAILSALRKELYGSEDNPRAKPGQKGISRAKAAQSVIQWLMERPTPAPPFGVTIYCWRCGSEAHSFLECPNEDLSCSRCEKSVLAWRRANAGTHVEGLCTFRG